MESEIRIQDLNVFIGNQQILKNINVDIPKNKITAIIGPSGCGKTTLLKCMNRLIDLCEGKNVSGKILIDNDDILAPDADLTRIRQKMGLLSQRPYPLPMNIYDNVAYGLRINGIKRHKDLDSLIQKHLEHANLWDEVKNRLKEPASKLSIGQQQRLCLARGLAVDPEIILADEPTSALDPISSQAIEEKFVELKKDYTIVIVTHILRQAKRLADYILFMYLGELIEHGPADEILNNPKKEKTKNYLKGLFN